MEKDLVASEKLLYRQVRKLPLVELLKNKNKPPKGRTHVIVEDISQYILSFCSEDYKLRKNSNIFKPFEKLLKQNEIAFHKDIIVIDNNKFYVDYTIQHRLKSDIINDILPKISIWNSYDGTVKTQVHFGYHRLLCGNKLSRPTNCKIKVSSKHSASEQEFVNETIPRFLELFKAFTKEASSDMKIFEKMQKKKAPADFLLKIANKLKFSKEARDMAKLQLVKEISGEMEYLDENRNLTLSKKSAVTMFAVYNALNYAIYHTNSKELPEFKSKKDRVLIDEICSSMNSKL